MNTQMYQWVKGRACSWHEVQLQKSTDLPLCDRLLQLLYFQVFLLQLVLQLLRSRVLAERTGRKRSRFNPSTDVFRCLSFTVHCVRLLTRSCSVEVLISWPWLPAYCSRLLSCWTIRVTSSSTLLKKRSSWPTPRASWARGSWREREEWYKGQKPPHRDDFT